MLTIGCASGTGLDSVRDTGATSERPVRIVVQAFATTGEQAARQPGPAPQLADALQAERLSAEEDATGRALADALADQLVIRIQGMGLPARQEAGEPAAEDEAPIFGQILSVWEDPPGERAALGVRTQRSEMRTRVQSYGLPPQRALLKEFEILTAGKGANVGEGFAGGRAWTPPDPPSGFGTSLPGELRAEAWSTLRRIVDPLALLFEQKGWITPPPQYDPQSASFPPHEVRVFLGRADHCRTWTHFHVFDEKSREAQEKNVKRYCTGIEEQREMLRERYAYDPRVLDLITDPDDEATE